MFKWYSEVRAWGYGGLRLVCGVWIYDHGL